MKRKSAKEILAESFRELAEEKGIDQITVKEITDNCGYFTDTVYLQFKDKYDMIAWDYASHISEILGRIGKDDNTWKQTLLNGAKRYDERKEYIANLLLHTSGHDSFISYMTEINCRELARFVKKATGSEKLDQKTEMYIRLFCMGTVCLTCEWILGKYEATPEEMAEIYEKSLPAPLSPLFRNK